MSKIESGEGVPSTELMGALGNSTTGAEQVQKLAMRDLSVDGAVADAWARDAEREPEPSLEPRVPAAREYAQQLAENTVYQTMHNEDAASGLQSRRLRASPSTHAACQRSPATTAPSRPCQGGVNMSRKSLRASAAPCATAIRNANPFVARSAQAWRSKVPEPFKKELELECCRPTCR